MSIICLILYIYVLYYICIILYIYYMSIPEQDEFVIHIHVCTPVNIAKNSR